MQSICPTGDAATFEALQAGLQRAVTVLYLHHLECLRREDAVFRAAIERRDGAVLGRKCSSCASSKVRSHGNWDRLLIVNLGRTWASSRSRLTRRPKARWTLVWCSNIRGNRAKLRRSPMTAPGAFPVRVR